MSMTRADAKNYIARVLSAVQSQQAQVWAEESLQRAFTDWQLARNWEFLLKDTSLQRNIGFLPYISGQTIYTLSSHLTAFRGANVGQEVFASVFTGGKTTIANLTYADNGQLATVVFAAPANTTISVATSLSADIPINVGQTDYNLPVDFYAPATTRILGSSGQKIEYIRNGTWYRAATAPDNNGAVDFYTLFNARSALTTNYGETRLRLRRPPEKADTLRVEYFRTFDRDSDPLDIPDDYLYKFLDYCRALILESRRAADDPGAYAQRALSGLGQAVLSDSEQADDEDVGLISQMDVFPGGHNSEA